MQFIESLSEEHASEDLEEYYKNEFLPKEWFAEPGQRTISEFNFFTAKHFAEWQKQKDQETIELAEDQAMKDFLEKACEWLSRNARNYYSAYATSDRLVNDFKQYMEEEK